MYSRPDATGAHAQHAVRNVPLLLIPARWMVTWRGSAVAWAALDMAPSDTVHDLAVVRAVLDKICADTTTMG